MYAADGVISEWQRQGTVAGQPAALDVTDAVWHVATDTGIYASDDDGATWTAVVETEH